MTDRPPTVVVLRDAGVLAAAVAARLVSSLVDAQAERGTAAVVLTGGTIGTAALAAVASSPARDAVHWDRVDLWWGDERFLPVGDPERNDTQARAALLDHLPLDAARVHPFPASDGPDGDDVDAAAARYAVELAGAASAGEALPRLDVVLLGVGPDGHVASVFPEFPAAREERPVVGVRGAPKPPPTRLTLTLPTLSSAEEVWLVAAGTGKADAVAMAFAGPGPIQVPAAGVHGRSRTVWLLDTDAAAALSIPPRQHDPRQHDPGRHLG